MLFQKSLSVLKLLKDFQVGQCNTVYRILDCSTTSLYMMYTQIGRESRCRVGSAHTLRRYFAVSWQYTCKCTVGSFIHLFLEQGCVS